VSHPTLPDLNEEQQPAVLAPDGPALVLAGAGSGKTRVLTYRAAHLLSRGVPAPRILLLTFTKKASRVMQDRLTDLMGPAFLVPWAGTFHHVGYRLIREFGHRIGVEGTRTLLDREDQRDLIKEIRDAKAGEIPEEELPPAAAILGYLSLASNLLIPLREVLRRRAPWLSHMEKTVEAIDRRYREEKATQKILDFDDLLLLWLRLLEESPETASLLRERFRHVLVDEYQDTNPLQGRILDLLACDHKNLFVVGDDSQSIYSFRGAAIDNILTFQDRYPEAGVYRLEKNYRSTPNILNVANRIIERNSRQIPKTLYSPRPEADHPTLVRMYSDIDQARFIVGKIRRALDRGHEPSEIAVLYRAHYVSLSLQLALSRERIPFHLTSGLKFYEQAHIKDVLSWLRLLENAKDAMAWKRILRMVPRVGKKTAEKAFDHLARTENPKMALVDPSFLKAFPAGARPGLSRVGETFQALGERREKAPGNVVLLVQTLLDTGYHDYLYETFEDPESREEDIISFANQIPPETALGDFLAELALLEAGGDDLSADEIKNRIVLSTIHQSKGLEWDMVFLLSLADGVFPSARSSETPEDLEEERRLFYVAVTRARHDLILCVPQVIGRGYGSPAPPSRFLEEIGDEHLTVDSYNSWED